MSLGDTSGFQLAIAKDPGVNGAAVTATALQILPVVSESLNSTRESKKSMEMDGTRQTADTKIVKASVGGGFEVEFAYSRLDALMAAAFQSDWVNDASVVGHTEDWLMDGATPTKWVFEKLNRNNKDDGKLWNFFERSFQNVIDSFSMNCQPSEIIKCSFNTLGTTDETAEADASVNPLAGKMGTVTSYTADAGNARIDASNSLSGVTLKSAADADYAVVVQDLSISLANNMRERAQVGSLYSAEHGNGDLTVEIDMKIYFKDLEVKKAFLADQSMKLSFTLQDPDNVANKYVVHMDRIKAQTHNMNAGGKSQDLIETIKFEALPFDKTIDSVAYKPVIAIQRFA